MAGSGEPQQLQFSNQTWHKKYKNASNNVGIVRFDQSELSPESVTKINGLHDVGVQLLRANPYNNKLLVIYQRIATLTLLI